MSELMNIKQHPQTFWLGPVIHVYEIAEFAFVEYQDFSDTLVKFSIYIAGHSIGRTAESLDAAMAQAIAFKYEGCNSYAGSYFLRMVGNSPHKDYQILQKQKEDS